ncbi:hypothetical protein HKB01_04390, partial [Vibrio parahaemolyticus]|nr:hypothetical protein [Vibrio parahaemolyticus]
CGSLEPLDISETGERGYIEGTIGDENTFKFIPFAKRKYIKKKIDISAEMNYFDVINLVKNDSENCNLDFLILEINGIRAKDFEINIIKEYLQREYFYVEIIDNTILDFDLRELKNKYENTLIQYYIDSFTEEELKEELFRKSLYIG